MADKSMKVTLRAEVQDYLRGMEQVARKNKEVRDGSNDLEQSLNAKGDAMQTVGTAAMGAGGAMLAFAGMATVAAANFDEGMSKVQAATMSSTEEMEQLRAAAIQAGADTAYSATEAAGAIEELAKAGLTTEEILSGGLDGALSLAAAGGLEVSRAAEIAAVSMKQFGLSGGDVEHVADLLAAGAGKAVGSVEDMSQALKQSGLVASQMGMSVEETTGSLAAFAAAGLIGSDAGTSLRTMLLRLSNPSKEASKAMDEIGLAAYDAQGSFVGMAALAGQLETGLKGATQAQKDQALATIFGSDAIRAANVLISEGAAGMSEWEQNVNDAGFASEQAAMKMDNLKGDLEKLSGSWETAMITMGKESEGPLRGTVQGLTEMIDTLSEADPAFQTVMLSLTGIGGALLLAGGAFMTIVPQIAATKAAMVTLGITSDALKSKLVALGTSPTFLALFAVTGVALTASAALDDARMSAEELEATFNRTGSASQTLTESLRQTSADAGWVFSDLTVYMSDFEATLNRISTADFGEWMSVTQGEWEFARQLQDVGDQLGQLASTDLPSAQAAFKAFVDEQHLGVEAQWQLLESMDGYKEALLQQANAAGVTVGDLSTLEGQQQLLALANGETTIAIENSVDALAEQSAAALDTSGQVDSLTESLKNLNQQYYDSLDAEMAWEEAIDSLTESLAQNGATLDLDTEAGRNNMRALMEAGQASRDYAADIYATTGDVDAMTAALEAGWQQIYDTAIQMGASADEAEEYANKLNGVPSEIATAIKADTEQAQKDVDTFITTNDGRTITLRQAILGPELSEEPEWHAPMLAPGTSNKFALGGAVYGGVPGRDSVPALLMPGEHVWTTAEVNKFGGHAAMYALRQAVRAGNLPRYATGGAVGATTYNTSYGPTQTVNFDLSGLVGVSPSQVRQIVGSMLDEMGVGYS